MSLAVGRAFPCLGASGPPLRGVTGVALHPCEGHELGWRQESLPSPGIPFTPPCSTEARCWDGDSPGSLWRVTSSARPWLSQEIQAWPVSAMADKHWGFCTRPCRQPSWHRTPLEGGHPALCRPLHGGCPMQGHIPGRGWAGELAEGLRGHRRLGPASGKAAAPAPLARPHLGLVKQV